MRGWTSRSCAAVLAWLLLCSAAPAFAQDCDAPDIQELRDASPPSLRTWIEGLPAAQRRAATRRLRNMSEQRRAHFFQRWEGMSDLEREHVQQRMERRNRGGQGRDYRDPVDRPAREHRGMRDRQARDHQELRDRQTRDHQELRDRQARDHQELRDGQARDHQDLRDRMSDMTPTERRAFRRQLRSWRQLDTKKKDGLRRRLRGFRELSPAAQEHLVERRFHDKSSEERRHILKGLRAASRSAH